MNDEARRARADDAAGNPLHEVRTVDADGVRLAVYLSGPSDAPPLILVHGYPDSARVWDPVRAHLAHRFRVIAYDVRGAGASDAPRGRSAYRLERLAADLLAVADATCGTRPFHLAAHDWGSIQCWEAVSDPRFAGRIASYTSISGPCLDHASVALRGTASATVTAANADIAAQARRERRGMPQFLKSWYRVLPSAAAARTGLAARRCIAVAAVAAAHRAGAA